MCTSISGESADSIFWVDSHLLWELCLTGWLSRFYADIPEVWVPAFSGADYIASHRRGLILIGHLTFIVQNWDFHPVNINSKLKSRSLTP